MLTGSRISLVVSDRVSVERPFSPHSQPQPALDHRLPSGGTIYGRFRQVESEECVAVLSAKKLLRVDAAKEARLADEFASDGHELRARCKFRQMIKVSFRMIKSFAAEAVTGAWLRYEAPSSVPNYEKRREITYTA